jgi:hypothetical protein
MRAVAAAAIFAAAALSAAAGWMGALNQAEGWYIYVAGMVADGLMPYRDFFFTQAPVMPLVYSAFAGAWECLGLLGARLVTLGFGAFSIVFALGIARNLAPEGRKGYAALIAFMLLGCNLYHLYYLAILPRQTHHRSRIRNHSRTRKHLRKAPVRTWDKDSYRPQANHLLNTKAIRLLPPLLPAVWGRSGQFDCMQFLQKDISDGKVYNQDYYLPAD